MLRFHVTSCGRVRLMQRMLQKGRSVLFRRFPLAAVFLFVCFVRIHGQALDSSDAAATTRLIGGALEEARYWTPLFKLCIGPGRHHIVANYFFPASNALHLSKPYNLNETSAPWVLLYPEATWADAHFFTVKFSFIFFVLYVVKIPHGDPHQNSRRYRHQLRSLPLLDSPRFCRVIASHAFFRSTLEILNGRNRVVTGSFLKCHRTLFIQMFLSQMISLLKQEPMLLFTLPYACVMLVEFRSP
jgi:hypothetical protein